MELTYEQVRRQTEWSDGSPDHPLGTAILWTKTYQSHLVCAVHPHPDSRETSTTQFTVGTTNNIEALIQCARLRHECDILNVKDVPLEDQANHLMAVARAYVRGPDWKPPAPTWWDRVKSWISYWRK